MKSRLLSTAVFPVQFIANKVGGNMIIRSIGAIISKAGDLLTRTKNTTTNWLQVADQLRSSDAPSLTASTVFTTIPSYIHTGTRLILIGLSDIPKDMADQAETKKIPVMNSTPVQGPIIALEEMEEGNNLNHNQTNTIYYFFKLTAITAVSFDTISAYFYTLQFINFVNSAAVYFVPEISPASNSAWKIFHTLAVLNASLYFYKYYSKLTTIPKGLVAWKKITDPKVSCLNNLRIIGDAVATASIAYGSSCMIGNRLFPKNSSFGITLEDASKTAQETIQITMGVVGAVSKGLYRFVDNGTPLKKNMEGKLEPSRNSWAQRHYKVSNVLAVIDSVFTGFNGTNGMITMAADIGYYAGFSCATLDLTAPEKLGQKIYITASFTINMLVGGPATYAKHKDYIQQAYQKAIKRPSWITPPSTAFSSPSFLSPASPLITQQEHPSSNYGSVLNKFDDSLQLRAQTPR